HADIAMSENLVYLVTGGCGYIGEYIVKLLTTQKYVKEVRVFDINESEEINQSSVPVKLIKGDITNYDQLLKAMEGVHVVIHTAALLDILDTMPFKKMKDINVGGTENVINACIANDVPYIVYTSSIAAVGPNTNSEPMIRATEETVYTGEIELSYGKTKALAERLIRQANGKKVTTLILCKITDCEYYCVVPGNVAWMHVQAAWHLRLKPELLGAEVYYAYDNTPMRQRYKLLYELFTEINPCIQMGSHIPYWKMWLIINIYNIIQFIVRPFWNLKPFMTLPILNIIVTSFSYETDKAFRHFGYQPLFDWAESKKRTCEWLKSMVHDVPKEHGKHKET
uniref:Provisional ortholog of hydroxy-delta-5-steroid dehydrogenase, 3 beta- and steroid delta-isomerase 7 n=1 Tax=Xenopus tropicalis TaxID=8364 RepID=F7D1A8_XENTR